MQKVIDQISDQLVGLIKTDRVAYTPKELLKVGIPTYIVERIRFLLEDRIREEIVYPTTKWSALDNQLMVNKWNEFLISAINNSQIPHQDLHRIIYIVVDEVLNVLIEPRKRIAKFLFRDDEVLGFAEMSKRCTRLTIYKHFGTAIPLYMQKRNLTEISRDRCSQLIHNIDERIVANYTADDWAQKLEILFALFGGKVNSELFVLFFKDKGLMQTADIFRGIDVSLTQSSFIELLSRDGLKDFIEEERTEEKSKESKPTESIVVESVTAKEDEIELEFESPSLAEKFAATSQPKITEGEMDDILNDNTQGGVIEVDGYDDSGSLNALFTLADQEKEEEAEIKWVGDQKEDRQEFSAKLDQTKDSFEDLTSASKKSKKEEEKVPPKVKEQKKEEIIEVEAEDDDINSIEQLVAPSEEQDEIEMPVGEDSPMWARFLSADQMENLIGSQGTEEDDEEKEAAGSLGYSFNEQLEVELPTDDEVDEAEKEIYVDDDNLIIDENDSVEAPTLGLKLYLRDKAGLFIDGIFDGAVWEYGEAMEHLEQLDEWQDASEYIQQEIFTRNNINMFSEVAIEFTDRLQSYFKDHKWR